jgi:signal peptidase II
LKKFFLILFFSIISVVKYAALDQASKWWVKSMLTAKAGYTMHITSFLSLVYSWNHGISFGLFREYHAMSNKIFLVINSIIIIYIWKLLFNAKSYKSYIGLSLIIGGAVGNLIDRFVNGAVFDFIYFHYNNFYFPAFNIADSFIFIGAAIVIYEYYRMTKSVAKQQEMSMMKWLRKQRKLEN